MKQKNENKNKIDEKISSFTNQPGENLNFNPNSDVNSAKDIKNPKKPKKSKSSNVELYNVDLEKGEEETVDVNSDYEDPRNKKDKKKKKKKSSRRNTTIPPPT